jgi:hypothetical protein
MIRIINYKGYLGKFLYSKMRSRRGAMILTYHAAMSFLTSINVSLRHSVKSNFRYLKGVRRPKQIFRGSPDFWDLGGNTRRLVRNVMLTLKIGSFQRLRLHSPFPDFSCRHLSCRVIFLFFFPSLWNNCHTLPRFPFFSLKGRSDSIFICNVTEFTRVGIPVSLSPELCT